MYTLSFWEKKWQQCKNRSLLIQTQKDSSDKWSDFYDNVSDLWLSMWGSPWELGDRVVNLLIANDVVQRGDRMLDAGCGSGAISIPSALQGMKITAVDNSKAMLDQLRSNADKKKIQSIEIIHSEWNDYIRIFPPPRYDCAVAAFFPPVFSPEGVNELEKLTDCCCLVMSDSEDPFPFRKELWQRIVRKPLPDRRHSLLCTYNYLVSSGRKPNIIHLSWPATLDMNRHDLFRFYSFYFAVFGYGKNRTERIIISNLARYGDGDRVCVTGEVRIAVIWWKN